MPKKKQRTQRRNNNDDDDDNSSTHSMETEEINEQITIDFEARSPEDIDFDSIKLLLHQKLGLFSINLGEFAEMIIQQSNIGNVIYQAVDEEPVIDTATASNNDDDTIFGIISLINLNKYKQKSCVKQLANFLNQEFHKLKKLDAKTKEFLDKNLFDSHRIGYLINERYINIPTEISIPMYESLLKDLEDKNDNEPMASAKTSAASNDNEFDYYMILARSYEPESGASKERDYANSEEEILKEFSEHVIEIKYPKSKDSQFNFYLEVLFLTKTKLNEGLSKIKSLIK